MQALLADDIEDVDAVVETFGPEPTDQQFETTDVAFSVRREERF